MHHVPGAFHDTQPPPFSLPASCDELQRVFTSRAPAQAITTVGTCVMRWCCSSDSAGGIMRALSAALALNCDGRNDIQKG